MKFKNKPDSDLQSGHPEIRNVFNSMQIKEIRSYIEGLIYEKLIAPRFKGVRDLVSSFVENGSEVIDIGCGTGEFSVHLAEKRGCNVTGVDLSEAMIDNAKRKNAHSQKVSFFQGDATNLSNFSDQKFDYATMSMMIHALPAELRIQAIREAQRIAKRIIIADWVEKQPFSIPGIFVRGIESVGKHPSSFRSYVDNGGLNPLLQEAGLSIQQEKLTKSETIRVVVA